VTSGLVILETYNGIWDIGIWPVIQHLFGVYGVLVLTLIALILNFAVLRWYQKHTKTDWLGITVVDDIVMKADKLQHTYRVSTGVHKLFIAIPAGFFWLAKKTIVGKWVPLLVLSLFTDGFVATAYYVNWKNKSMHCQLGKSEYTVLAMTTVISCLAWSLFTEWITLPAFQSLWHTITS
jgi:hypothetical protein